MLKRLAVVVALFPVLSLSCLQAATIPRRSPEFSINMPGGKQLPLSAYKGKVTAVLFILTYCPHCQTTIKLLSKLQNEYGARGFQVLASATEEMATAALPDFLRRFQPPFPVGFNRRQEVNDYLQHPVMVAMIMPRLVFIDRTFTIRAQYGGDDKKYFDAEKQESNIRADIEKLLKEGSAPTPASQRRKRDAATSRKKS
jgi:thiol-disulfide isomerase/thioredoxin